MSLPSERNCFPKFLSKRLRANDTLITGEATPDYILYPEYSARAILRTIPWVKMIVLLREPVDRLFSHYNFLTDPNRADMDLPDFETWVLADIQILQEFKVLPLNLSEIPTYMGSKQEKEGWDTYQ
jgi:hypothetical protein